MTTGFLTDSGIRVWSQTVNDETFDVAPHGRLAVRGARLDGCIFSGLHLKEFIFQGCERSVFSGCRFVNCRIDEWHHTFMDFVDCEFESVKIKKWRLDEGDVVDCRFEGAIADAVIWGDTAAKPGIEYRRNRFERNDLSGVDPCSVDFRSGVDLATNVLPGSGGCAPLLVLGCGPQVAQAPRSCAQQRNSTCRCRCGLCILAQGRRTGSGGHCVRHHRRSGLKCWD